MAVAITVLTILIVLLAVLALLPTPGSRPGNRPRLMSIPSGCSGASMLAPMRGHSQIVLHCLGGAAKSVHLHGERMSVGRSCVNDICCREDRSLSRQHLVFEKDGEDWMVSDIGSKNGTFVNGVRIAAKHVLHPGDRIMAGHTVIGYHQPFQPPAGDSASSKDAGEPVPQRCGTGKVLAPSQDG